MKHILLTKSVSVVCVTKSTVCSSVDGLVGSFQLDTVNTPHAANPPKYNPLRVSNDDLGGLYVVLTDVFHLAVQTLVIH